jgi:hypothetical protein
VLRSVPHVSRVSRAPCARHVPAGRWSCHCAWCVRLEIGDEWLRLATIGSG